MCSSFVPSPPCSVYFVGTSCWSSGPRWRRRSGSCTRKSACRRSLKSEVAYYIGCVHCRICAYMYTCTHACGTIGASSPIQIFLIVIPVRACIRVFNYDRTCIVIPDAKKASVHLYRYDMHMRYLHTELLTSWFVGSTCPA